MQSERLSEGLNSINIDMMDDKKGIYWPGFVALGAVTFAIFNFLTRWLLPGGRDLFVCLFEFDKSLMPLERCVQRLVAH